ncbi:MAG: hypothetical protein ACREHG_09890, partial [Candidatus Saccharimonadales bacterium]
MSFIGAAAYKTHLRRRSPVYITSLHEIDRVTEEKRREIAGAGDDLTDEQEVEARLPAAYKDFKDVFSKKDSDILPPFRKNIDFKLELEEGKDPVKEVGHAPLYKMNLEELEAVKTYLEANLQKGFIVPSSAPFASPILIAHSGNKLRFCVDSRKLNA